MAERGKKNIQSKKTTIDGIEFASKFEAERYIVLKQKEKDNEIYELRTHLSFPLERGGVKVAEIRGSKVRTYTPDFVYLEPLDGPERHGWQRIAEDTKGVMTQAASLRMSIFKALYPEIELRVIKQGKRRNYRKKKR